MAGSSYEEADEKFTLAQNMKTILVQFNDESLRVTNLSFTLTQIVHSQIWRLFSTIGLRIMSLVQ